MSHIVTIKAVMKDQEAITAACKRCNLEAPQQGGVVLYREKRNGTVVRLKGWEYPIVISPAGEIAYDNYEGRWGDKAELDRFRQAYTVEKTRLEAVRKGHRYSEVRQDNGSIQVTITTR